eukprot:sb/3477247/
MALLCFVLLSSIGFNAHFVAPAGITETDALLSLLEQIRALCEVNEQCMMEMVVDMIYNLTGEKVEEVYGENHTIRLLRLIQEYCSDRANLPGCIENTLEDLSDRALDLI